MLNPVETAVLAAYQAEAASRGVRRPLVLDKHALAGLTGISASRCCNARASLIARKLLRKIGHTIPMQVELLAGGGGDHG